MNILDKYSCIFCKYKKHQNYEQRRQKRERELKASYETFIQTERGKEWKHFWQSQTGSERRGDFGDYLYDFYPEMPQ